MFEGVMNRIVLSFLNNLVKKLRTEFLYTTNQVLNNNDCEIFENLFPSILLNRKSNIY